MKNMRRATTAPIGLKHALLEAASQLSNDSAACSGRSPVERNQAAALAVGKQQLKANDLPIALMHVPSSLNVYT